MGHQDGDEAVTLRVGVIGVGTMGSLHARVVATHPSTTLAWVCDPSEDVGRPIAERFSTSYLNVPEFENVDAVVVAAPTQYHVEIGLSVLDHDLPLLLEKPLAEHLTGVSQLLRKAEDRDIPLMCGLLERFNPAVRTAFELSRDPIHFRSVRHSPMTSRISTGVGGDLLIHDLDLVLRLFGSAPLGISGLRDKSDARGGESENIAELMLSFGESRIASLSASRRSQRKIRSISIAEPDRLIEVDLLRQDVTIYRHVLESPAEDDLGYRQNTIIDLPVLRFHGEPLMLQLDHFIDLIYGKKDYVTERHSLLLPHEVLAKFIGS